MIRFNGQNKGFKLDTYPDGTPAIKADLYALHNWYQLQGEIEITWLFDNMGELATLWMTVQYLREHCMKNIVLNMPYCPNARMDRTKCDEDVAAMKFFGKMINQMGFKQVKVLDPHSIVVQNTINNLKVQYPTRYIQECLDSLPFINLIFYPDHGAETRYEHIHEEFYLPYVSGYKQRDWRTGKIEGLKVIGDPYLIEDKSVLIVDDICSKGGTFLHAARELKNLGAKSVYLYVTHCENTVLEGEMINSGLIEHIFTTDSIFRGDHLLISVMKLEH